MSVTAHMNAALALACLAACLAAVLARPGPADVAVVSSGPYRSLQSTCDSPTFTALKPSTFDAKAVGLQWVGVDDQYVFVITMTNRVYRSKDGGSSFEEITERFDSSIKKEEPVALVRIIPHATNPNNILFLGAGNYIWTSTDYGETLIPHKTPGWVGMHSSLRPHPARPDWVLALVRRPGCSVLDQVQLKCVSDLVLTQNAYGDQTWTNLTANANGQIAGFVDWDWGMQGCHKHGCQGLGIDETTIFATMYAKAGDWDVAWDPDVHFVVSNDWFKSMKKRIACGNQFELLGRQVYLAVSNSCPTTMDGKPSKGDTSGLPGITLYSSGDGANSFVQTCLPVAIKQEGFELMETHDGEGAVVVVDYMTRAPSGYLRGSSAFTAGPHHALFSLSLTSIYRADALSAASDFMRVDGIPGVFIANQMSPRRAGSSSPTGGPDRGLVETRITFNGGGSWTAIPAPSHINHPKCDRCGGSKDCSLHLHGASSWFFGNVLYPTVYSHPSSPGLLMASGNVGTSGVGLDDNDGVCTWLSYDGGFSWQDVAEGTWIYEYADWGGIVVMTKHAVNGPADEVRFSLDYGRCWKTVPLDTALAVDNIRIESDGQRPKVLIHGKACRKSDHPKCSYDTGDSRPLLQGLVYALDISSLMGDKLPLCIAKDYEQWTLPAEDHTPRCLLGAERQFTRRKQDAACLNGAAWQRPAPVNKTCQCTAADVECDYGWQREGDTCRRLTPEKLPQCPVLESGTYTVSESGKRLAQGDVCTGIDKIISDTDGKGKGCGHRKGGGSGGGSSRGGGGGWKGTTHGLFSALLAVSVVSVVLVGVVGVWYKFLASEAAQVQAEDAVAGTVGWLGSLGALVVMKAQQLVGGSIQRLSGSGSAGASRYEPLDAELNYFQPIADAGEEFPMSTPAANGGAVYSLK